MLWYIYLFHGNKTRPASSSYEMLTDSVIFCLSFYALQEPFYRSIYKLTQIDSLFISKEVHSSN